MKRKAWQAGALLIAAIAMFFLSRPDDAAPETPTAAASRPSTPSGDLPQPRPAPTRHPLAESAATLNDPSTTADDDISILSLIISQYGKILGGNPVGENEEITSALMGDNPKRLAFLPAKGAFLDSSGRLTDRWGTPYFFHALSGSKMEIISAGPDRKHRTGDDITSG
ncbi:hypothetical protein HZ994_11815 [Akkermansiaceae bacterium]|nr:hypothetical protein HZ994_11815 [Akkermansiaceae bacterium]